MKKLIYLSIVLTLAIGCTHKSCPKVQEKDSIVTVFGFAKMPIDSSIRMPYRKFTVYKDSFMPVYDTASKKVIFMRSKCNDKYGDWYINNNGDTLFCVEDGYAKYVSSEEWHEYYERFK